MLFIFFQFELLRDKDPKVRVKSINAITGCLLLVSSVPKTDINIFPEYILPNLNDVSRFSVFI